MFRLLVLCLLLSTPASAQEKTELPDPALTPGAVRTTDKTEICNTRTKGLRNVSGAMKMAVYARYGLTAKRDGQCNTVEGCEVDHLISLQLGGSNDVTNLWIQPYVGAWNAHRKDKLEGELHRRICAGRITPEEAQTLIRGDWTQAYRQIFGTDVAP